jgi:hypothetical protein
MAQQDEGCIVYFHHFCTLDEIDENQNWSKFNRIQDMVFDCMTRIGTFLLFLLLIAVILFGV